MTDGHHHSAPMSGYEQAMQFQQMGQGPGRPQFWDNVMGEDRAGRWKQTMGEAFQKFVQGVQDLWAQLGGQAPNQARVEAMVPDHVSLQEMKMWQKELRSECRRIERDITKLRKEEEKLQKDIQALVNRGDTASAQYIATQVVRGREAAARLEKTRLSMTSAYMALTEQMATAQGVGALKRSTHAMHYMNGAIRGHEMHGVVKCMQKEMDSVQMTHEVVDDAFKNFHNEEDEAFLRDCEIAKAMGTADSRARLDSGGAPLMARIDQLEGRSVAAKTAVAHRLESFAANQEDWEDDVSSIMDRINNL